MRICLWSLGMAALLAAAPAAAQNWAIDEDEVLAQLNTARADPQDYKHGLEHYRSFFHANLLRYPGLNTDIETEEGVGVVNETIAYLDRQKPLGEVQPSMLLRAAAAEHLADQARTGGTGHDGSDGSSPGVRVQRMGGGVYVAEIISYGSVDAIDAMRQLIVDDGVADRGHRSIIYSGELRYAGVACGPHPRYRTMCVIDLGITADGRYPQSDARYAMR